MKNLFVALATLFILSTTYAQTGSGYGIKAELNYNANGDYFESIGSAAENPDRNIGFHLGIFGKIGNKFISSQN